MDENLWSVLCHALPAATLLFGIPGFLAPLIILFTQAKKSARVRWHAVEALNFQLTVLVVQVCFVVAVVVSISGLNLVSASQWWSMIVLPMVLGIPLAIYSFAMPIVASVRSGNGEYWRYPLTVRIIK